MAHNHDACIHDGPDLVNYTNTAFQLDGVASGFFKKAAGIFHCLFDAALIGHKGHVTDDKSIGCSASDRLGMEDHLVHDHRDCSAIAIYAHSQAIADEKHVQASCFSKLCCGKIIGGQEGDFLAVFLHFIEFMYHFFLSHMSFPFFYGEFPGPFSSELEKRSSSMGQPSSDLTSEKARNVSDFPKPGSDAISFLTSTPSWLRSRAAM